MSLYRPYLGAWFSKTDVVPIHSLPVAVAAKAGDVAATWQTLVEDSNMQSDSIRQRNNFKYARQLIPWAWTTEQLLTGHVMW